MTTSRSIVALVALSGAGLFLLAASTPASGQTTAELARDWTPARLTDGQPDIQGMWNNVDASSTPLELPDGFSGPDFSTEDLQAIAKARAEAAARPGGPTS